VLSVLTVLALIQPSPGADRRTSHTGSGQSLATPHAAGESPAQPPSTGTPALAGVIHLWQATDSTPCLSNATAKLVVVSIGEQRAWMCDHARQVYSTLVTTGAADAGDGTPIGSWQVQARQTDRYLTGPGYRDFVHYWVPFDGDFGFHDASWQTMPFGAPGYRANGSHGCVHLPMPAMAWLYRWAQVGTTVTVET
jgi:lipoprotein-anchoring transpeptidase ErfK/SrfK